MIDKEEREKKTEEKKERSRKRREDFLAKIEKKRDKNAN